MQALADASGGHNIVYICPTIPARDYTERLAKDCAHNGTRGTVKIWSGDHKIDFTHLSVPGGWIKFITKEQFTTDVYRFQGLHDVKVVYDV